MTTFSERLWPAPWLFIATALVIPASFLVFLPINVFAGMATAAVLYAACIVLLLIASPRIEVSETELVAGRARLPRDVIGSATAFTGEDATTQRGRSLDARAWLLIRGWVSPVVRIELVDPNDPTPYWLVSTRRPNDLVAALSQNG